MTPLSMQSPVSARAEHVSLESETDITAPPARAPHRKTLSSYALKSSMRKCSTELSLLDEHYLQVHSVRAGKEPKKYTIDLRFLNSQPVRIRSVAWTWFTLSVVSLAISVLGAWLAWPSAKPFSSAASAGACIALIAALVSAVEAFRSTTESLNFTSVHGGATFVSVLGGFGSAKEGKSFFVAMIKHIAAAKAARQQPKQQWLRDEMREHHRLRELGVLTEADYEESKARILRAHA